MPDLTDEQHIKHIGIKRRSGRYPWGSGSDPYQRSVEFKKYYDDLKKGGLTDPQIADGVQTFARLTDPHATFTTTDLRAATSISTEEIFTANSNRAAQLKADGNSNGAIAEIMGLPRSAESTVRGWLQASEHVKESSLRATANALKERVEGLRKDEVLDVGKGQHLYMGVTATKFNTALAMLKDEGYEIHSNILVPQPGSVNFTRFKVLTKEGVSWAEARLAIVGGRLKTITAQSDDGGSTFRTPKDLPIMADSKKIAVRYGKEGAKMDGVIELRRGVADLDLGESRYAQVRIAVDGTHYIKGMAMYADDLPAGVNMRVNTPKMDTGNKLDALKPLKSRDGKIDPDGPFGSSTYPHMYVDKSGKEHQSVLNIVGTPGRGNIEGRWDQWSRSLSSQFLSKQPVALASRQLAETQKKKRDDLATIMALTNPVVKKKLLQEYADSTDAAAEHLKAAKLPRQAGRVILPMNTMRPHEVYAPGFENGERVALVRHPHGGPFEIPELTVNNKNLTAKRIMGDATDAIGIHHSVAEKLSGADFDGDTVVVIPNDSGRVKSRPSLTGLQNFDPRSQYAIPEGDTKTPRLTKKTTQPEMGKISNLITDMSIHKAPDEEIARAVRHSMVVIDAEKHGLNYKKSELDNNIAELKAKYQGSRRSGASTIISRAGAEARPPQFKVPSGDRGINPRTGEIVRIPTNRTYVNSKGKTVTVTTKVSRMSITKDARELLSGGTKHGGTPMEELYAAHANTMKELANTARKESVALKMPRQSPAAKALYAEHVTSLDAKVKVALRNAPLERRALVLGNAIAKARIDSDPSLDKDAIKKIQYEARDEGRRITGANKTKVYITDGEWRAIQAGAISHTRLSEIFTHSDMERVKELATPRSRSSLSPGQVARARALAATGKPMSQIAEQLGIPRSTLIDNLKA